MPNTNSGQENEGAALPVKYARSTTITASRGLSKGTLYNLQARGLIRSKLVKITGEKSGCRLWDVSSIDAFIAGQPSEVSR